MKNRGVAFFAVILVVTAVLCACGKTGTPTLDAYDGYDSEGRTRVPGESTAANAATTQQPGFFDRILGLVTENSSSAPPPASASVSAVPSSFLPQGEIITTPAPSGEISTLPAEFTNLTLPEPNGVMNYSNEADNKFIKTVMSKYGISGNLLFAVFSVPDTGQNYVLEFNDVRSSDGTVIKTADNLRRCYLIDTSGNVSSVAATDPAERENISALENNLCMNTIIKKIIFPYLEDYLAR